MLAEESPASQLPLDYQSRNTLTNIAENKKRMDYCISTFKFIENRVKCIEAVTGGPYLA
eukprot:CAMPEP_0113668850 /NCGR_PEP_ID=MMETSP0038_2-20120614/4232_1 /TAXON_ID=2898 /ORGANISM="Cryptomonas paramecium" /LENGTH=58 /DNA_ID=CAMNT_0000584645 /DNA_START=36 /DNA_END=212 /DNA_ORIENTATION=+ /assembly_acc=CAM_ASM_000170